MTPQRARRSALSERQRIMWKYRWRALWHGMAHPLMRPSKAKAWCDQQAREYAAELDRKGLL